MGIWQEPWDNTLHTKMEDSSAPPKQKEYNKIVHILPEVVTGLRSFEKHFPNKANVSEVLVKLLPNS